MAEIVPINRPFDAAVVDALRLALSEAESGDLVAFVMIKVRYDGGFATLRKGKSSQRELIGSLMFAVHDVMENSTFAGSI